MEDSETGLSKITTAKILKSFHESPRNFQTSFHGSPGQKIQTISHASKHWDTHYQFSIKTLLSNESPCHSKEWQGKLANLEIRIISKSDFLRERTVGINFPRRSE